MAEVGLNPLKLLLVHQRPKVRSFLGRSADPHFVGYLTGQFDRLFIDWPFDKHSRCSIARLARISKTMRQALAQCSFYIAVRKHKVGGFPSKLH